MSGYISSAKHVFDENNNGFIEIEYNKYIKSTDSTRVVIDTIYTFPKGDWQNISFSLNDYMSYHSFLKTMVYNTIEVTRKIAQLQLEYVLENSYNKHVKLMNMICILDPTFTPPFLNLKCTWQRKLLWNLASDQSYNIISNCFNKRRLTSYTRELESISL